MLQINCDRLSVPIDIVRSVFFEDINDNRNLFSKYESGWLELFLACRVMEALGGAMEAFENDKGSVSFLIKLRAEVVDAKGIGDIRTSGKSRKTLTPT